MQDGLMRFSELYVRDSLLISGLVSEIDNHKASLEQLCQRELSVESAESLAGLAGRLAAAQEIRDRYAQFTKEEMTREFREQYASISGLADKLESTEKGYLTNLFSGWRRSRELIESHGNEEPRESLKKARAEIEQLLSIYSTLAGLVPGWVSQKGNEPEKKASAEIEEYAGFCQERSGVVKELDKIEGELRSAESISSGRLQSISRRLDASQQSCSELSRKHRSAFDRMLGRSKLFECGVELAQIEAARDKISGIREYASDNHPAQDHKLLESWIAIYRNNLEYLGKEHEINAEHVENVCRIEFADNRLAQRVAARESGTQEYGGYIELEKAVRSQLEKELERISRELGRREQILDDEVNRKDFSLGKEEQRDSLELLLAASDELFRMKKMVCGEAGNVVALRSALERRLKQSLRGQGERQRDESSFGISLQEYPDYASPVVEDRRNNSDSRYDEGTKHNGKIKGQIPDYNLIVRNAAYHLSSLGSQLEEDVLSVEGIKEVYAARDSYYVSLSVIGMPVPVAEIEKVVSGLYTRDKRRIEVFVKKKGKSGASAEIVKRAKHYARVLDAWESLAG